MSQAFRILDEAGIPFEIRKRASAPPPDAFEGERDISLATADLERAERALGAAGWHRLHSFDGRHAFFVKVRDGRWAKLDAKLKGPASRGAPLSLRRRAPVVALVGPDGAGKSTVIEEVAALIPLGVRVAYLGNRGAGRPGRGGTPKSGARETAGVLKDTARAARRLAREHWAATRGSIVLCDRHPKELLAVRPRRPHPAAALERFLVRWLLPWPDALIVLEAPAEVLHARKPEHPIERLEEWLRSYRTELGPRGATFVDTAAPREETVREVSELVWDEVARRTGR